MGEGNSLTFSASAGEVVTIRIGNPSPGTPTLAQVQILPNIPSVTGLDCDEDLVPDQVEVTWTNPPALPTTRLRSGSTEPSRRRFRGRRRTTPSVLAPGFVGILEICVRGIIGAQPSLETCCLVSVGGPDNDDCDDAIDIGGLVRLRHDARSTG